MKKYTMLQDDFELMDHNNTHLKNIINELKEENEKKEKGNQVEIDKLTNKIKSQNETIKEMNLQMDKIQKVILLL